jgi:hypothetical protein
MSSDSSSQFNENKDENDTGETPEEENSSSENNPPSDDAPTKRRYRQSKKDEVFDYQPELNRYPRRRNLSPGSFRRFWRPFMDSARFGRWVSR